MCGVSYLAMSNRWQWNHYEIEEAASDATKAWHEQISGLPESPAIYLWRLRFGARLEQRGGMKAFMVQLNQELEKPVGSVEPVMMGTTVLIGHTKIGGGKLSEKKQQFLFDNYGNEAARADIVHFYESLDCFAPVLYVGKSQAVRTRLKQHLDGETNLRSYLHDSLERDWRSVTLSVLPLPAAVCKQDPALSAELLGVFEMITQLALAPHGVIRQG